MQTGYQVSTWVADCKEQISGVINFVTGNLRPVRSDTDESLSGWYKENSRVYVASDHACWNDHELTRKVNKRRFGTVVRSRAIGLNKMMKEHKEEAVAWIKERTGESQNSGDTTEEDEQGGSTS